MRVLFRVRGVAAAVAVAAAWMVPTAGADQPALASILSRADRAARLGRLAEADLLYREVLGRAPQHARALERLHGLVADRRVARDSDSCRATRDLLPRGFRRHETEHFVVLSNAGLRRSRQRGELLERTYRQFRRYAERLELPALPLRHKLVCVLFSQRSEFADFAAAHDGVTATWCLGYYAPRDDRSVFFAVEDEPDADEFAEARAIAATVHEVVHHLHYHTRVQAATVQYPLWSGEGLATAFETDSPDGDFGPAHDFGARRQRFERIVERGGLMPLTTFVQLDRLPDGRRETIHTVYNQAYALASWLARQRPAALRAYLVSMLYEPPGRPVPERHLELFEQAFGDVEVLEAAWLRAMSKEGER